MYSKETFLLIRKILTEAGVVSLSQLAGLEEELKYQEFNSYQDVENFLLKKKLITEEELLSAYSKYFKIPSIDLNKEKPSSDVLSLIPVSLLTRHILLPLRREEDTLSLALRDPFDISILEELKIITNLEIKPYLAKREDILKGIKEYYGLGAEAVEELVESPPSYPPKTLKSKEEVESLVEDSSLVSYVNQLLEEAYQKRATDIHIEPFSDKLRIRFRIDGFLYETKTPPQMKRLHSALITRFKVMANLNISEKRKPQDGRCRVKIKGQDIDLRLSTFPTLFGEGLSIRLLSKGSLMLEISQLGFSSEDLEKVKSLLAKPNGMVLVTGPTGCGKTTTLYSFLNYLNDSRINIVTLEDPIEYQLEGINQIQINPKIGFTFAEGLRSVLRQDPDVIMVGEIRDLETAEIAVRSALTGHLLFSTLHTNNSLSTITRLLDLGIEAYLLADTLRGVVAQRLIRLICNNCKEEQEINPELLESLGIREKKTFFKGRGCKDCHNTGYRGRTGIFELLVVDSEISSLIVKRASLEDILKKAKLLGFKTLKEDGLIKAEQGFTSLDEVIRVCEEV
ncbi:MAG: type II secretion system protein GspE [Candidatus Omnitrophota bacterium]|nr:MAG: type II secretion system protein GspE [Candidatus Omnitrophota bacterium]